MSAWPNREDPFDRAMRVLEAKREARRRLLERDDEVAAEEVEALRRLGHDDKRTG